MLLKLYLQIFWASAVAMEAANVAEAAGKVGVVNRWIVLDYRNLLFRYRISMKERLQTLFTRPPRQSEAGPEPHMVRF